MKHFEFSPTAQVDAPEYGLILSRANDQLNWGADIHDVMEAAERLSAVSPDNALVKLLRAKAKRLAWHTRQLARIRHKDAINV